MTAPSIGQEYPPADEAATTQQFLDMIREKLEQDYATGLMRRDAHPKHHGCVRARFVVEPDLPERLRIGVFGESRTYDAYIRYSNSAGSPQADGNRDLRGMAIKLLGVEGTRALTEATQQHTQDFLLVTHPVLPGGDVKTFFGLNRAANAGLLQSAWFFFNPFNLHIRELIILLRSFRRTPDALAERYWSMTPYRFGNGAAVKYSAIPTTATPFMALPESPSDDFLRERMVSRLEAETVSFDFCVQFQTDAVTMPIEDASRVWDEGASPFVKVATIHIDPQTFDTPEQMTFCENLAYSPWHALDAHRPLGGINRARKSIYLAISDLRHGRNGAPEEPQDEMGFAATP